MGRAVTAGRRHADAEERDEAEQRRVHRTAAPDGEVVSERRAEQSAVDEEMKATHRRLTDDRDAEAADRDAARQDRWAAAGDRAVARADREQAARDRIASEADREQAEIEQATGD